MQTVDLLADAGLIPFGAGRDLADARRPAVVERHGVSFGFVGFNAIGETPEAGPRSPGASSVSMPPRTGPLDRAELDRVLDDVRRLAARVDVVVVMPHWGTQYTERPEPIQTYVARQLVRAGADLVVGGHPHWVQGASMIGDGLLVNSLGNFTFDMVEPEKNEGLVLEATYWDDELKGVTFVPYRIGPDHAPRVVPYAAAERMFANFWRFSGLGAEPGPEHLAGPAQLRPVDDGGHVLRGVVGGVRRAAEPRRRQTLVGEGLVVAAGVLLDRGADAELVCGAEEGVADPRGRPLDPADGQRRPDADPVEGDHGPQVPALGRAQARDVVLGPEVVQVAGPARLLTAEGDEDDLPQLDGVSPPGGLEQHGDAGGVVLGPGRDGDRVEVRADDVVRRSGVEGRRGGDHVGGPARRDRDAPGEPAGTG